MSDTEEDGQRSAASLGYFGGLDRGNHYKIDVDKVSIPRRECTSVTDPLQLLPGWNPCYLQD